MEREIFPATPPGRTLFSENIMDALPDGILLREMLPDVTVLLDCRLSTSTTTTKKSGLPAFQLSHSIRSQKLLEGTQTHWVSRFLLLCGRCCQTRQRFFIVSFSARPQNNTVFRVVRTTALGHN
jgi:hypothetical protein